MNYRHCIYITILFLTASCGSDEAAEQKKLLIGKWNVSISEMNNKPNGFMRGAYFEFLDDNSVQSNLFTDNNSHSYNVDKGRLLINTDDNFDLQISKLNADTLVLEGKMKMYYIKFILEKSH